MEHILNSLWVSAYALLYIIITVGGIFALIGVVYEEIRDKREYERKHKEARELLKRISK